uniref:NADH-ubiquinone oxidoreductase chain 4L n=2 Tax=Oecanthus TaxID=208682 RepID=A0A1W6S5V0_9ORTH|nr:NADH dehydrogenase subunit 4L [Oecanthus sinensis]AQM39922.1 NADH dehydrogenase subunit 4L [Oecanthus rufescens]ARO75195.1 NADH dehydrogenase subunit 4L [Oecanthus sinensis]
MMTLMLMMMYLLMYMSGLWVYCSKRKHLLIVMLSLEYMVMISYVLFLYLLGSMDYGMFMSMLYLVFSVCEGVLGLGILVSVVRFYGNDYFQSFVVLRC